MLLSKNPYTNEELKKTEEMSDSDIDRAIQMSHQAFLQWRKTDFGERSRLMKKVAEELRKNSREYAETITLEMGKPITQSLAEVEKCAWVCEYYSENAEDHLAEEEIESDATKSYVSYEPLGVVLAVMPWNYPFWQVFRFAAPALMAGNVGLLKHSSNVMMCGENLQKIFERAGFPEGCFQNLRIGSKKVDGVIRDGRVKAVTLTGSVGAGRSVSSTAGEQIKKSVLELGGSNALVIFEDADISEAVKVCVQARYQNTGQSCIAGKRLLVHESIADKFLSKFKKEVEALKAGDPMDEETFIGVQAREDLTEDLEKQVRESVQQGAEIILGGNREGAFFEPTILTKVTKEMSVWKEETFGPAMAIMTFKTEDEAIDLVNSSEYGLGVSIFTENFQKAKKLIPQFEDGSVFVNEMVKSDPRLPFGGTKNSGFGRELSYHGIREFVNVKTVYFNKF